MTDPLKTPEDLVAILLPLLRARVTTPEAVRIDVQVPELGGLAILSVHADASDVGRIVGKRGHHIRRLRAVVESLAATLGLRVFVDVPQSRHGRVDHGDRCR